MKALVTGADGFVGHWLIPHLEEKGDEVWRLTASSMTAPSSVAVDLRDRPAVRDVIAAAKPEVIYHLAAIAYGPDARRDIEKAISVNVEGTHNLLSSAAALDRTPLVVVISSGEVYAPQPDHPLTERDAVGPVNAYGATKLAQESLALAYHHAEALPVAVLRPFNHIGPGQRSEFVVPAFAMQLAHIAAGHRPPRIEVGNLTARRDFTDVRDVVAAYRLVAEKRVTGQPLNVASGIAIGIDDVLQQLIAISGMEVEVAQDPARLRANDAPFITGDASELRRLTGWRPRVPLARTLRDVWVDALNRSRREPTPS